MVLELRIMLMAIITKANGSMVSRREKVSIITFSSERFIMENGSMI